MPPKRIDEIVELIDLYPTIHEVLGLEIPQAISGESLMPVMLGQPSDGVAFAEGFGFKVITPGWSSHHDYSDAMHLEGNARVRELYDLSRDPLERENRAEYPPVSADRHLSLVPRLWGEIGELRDYYAVQHDEVEMDPETIDRLRSLGYLGGGS